MKGFRQRVHEQLERAKEREGNKPPRPKRDPPPSPIPDNSSASYFFSKAALPAEDDKTDIWRAQNSASAKAAWLAKQYKVEGDWRPEQTKVGLEAATPVNGRGGKIGLEPPTAGLDRQWSGSQEAAGVVEADEARRQAALKASAVQMAQQMYESGFKRPVASSGTAGQALTSSQTDIKQESMRYHALQDAAQKLAAERLAKIDRDNEARVNQYKSSKVSSEREPRGDDDRRQNDGEVGSAAAAGEGQAPRIRPQTLPKVGNFPTREGSSSATTKDRKLLQEAFEQAIAPFEEEIKLRSDLLYRFETKIDNLRQKEAVMKEQHEREKRDFHREMDLLIEDRESREKTMNAYHEQQMRHLRETHATDMKARETETSADFQRQEAAHKGTFDRLVQDLNTARETHNTEMVVAENRHREDIDRMKLELKHVSVEYEDAMKEAEQNHEAERTKMAQDHEAEMARVNKNMQGLVDQYMKAVNERTAITAKYEELLATHTKPAINTKTSLNAKTDEIFKNAEESASEGEGASASPGPISPFKPAACVDPRWATGVPWPNLRRQAHFLPNGDTEHDGKETWTRLRELGRGAFGTVWHEKCTSEYTPKFRAVKQSARHQHVAWRRELAAMNKFAQHHDHFVQCQGWFEDDAFLYIAMEFIPHGTLEVQIRERAFPESEATLVVSQLAQALKHMHGAGFIHRDLKPLNVLVNHLGPAWHVKIADFGISKDTAVGGTTSHWQGTPNYLAPEILSNKSGRYTPAVDIWSLGAVAFCLLTRRPPFSGLDEMIRYVDGVIRFPTKPLGRTSFDGVQFILETMAPVRENRLDIDKVMSHPWLSTEDEVEAEPSYNEAHTASNAWEDTWTALDRHDTPLGPRTAEKPAL